MNNFVEGIYPTVDLNNFVPSDFLSAYDYYEEFDPNKNYDTNEFLYNYNYGTRKYQFVIYNFRDKVSQEIFSRYVASREILSEDELSILKRHCQCSYHNMYWWNPLRLIICRCCVGCLDTEFYQMWVLKETRKYIENNNQLN